jgi:UDP-glucose 4-epimerase
MRSAWGWRVKKCWVIMTCGDYKNKFVLVTGGLGFIGSNLVIRLLALGARVTVIDSLVEGCGGNIDNLGPVLKSIRIKIADIKDAHCFAAELERPDVIFNLAGEVSHSASMEAPMRDLELNTRSQLAFLMTCVGYFPGVRTVYASTRQVYGVCGGLPVAEDHPIEPVDFNGVHKFATSAYHLLLSKTGKIDAIVLRITNVYGPRMALNVMAQGVLSVYLRNALAGQPIQIYGEGKQLRDPVHVSDVVDAFLSAGLASGTSRVFNVGGPEALEIKQIAKIAAAAGHCDLAWREFDHSQKAIDIGSYRADASRIARELKWQPRIRFEEGFPAALQSYMAEPQPLTRATVVETAGAAC